MSDGEVRSYHGQPLIKEPVWTWEVPCYLFSGGLAGASAAFAYGCELRGEHAVARRAWGVAMGGLGISPVFLVMDLGRPERFLHMLRMVKVTSPMSVGTWVLMASSGTTALAAGRAWLGLLPGVGRVAAPAAAFFGLPLATYTAALFSTTSVPAWHEARTTLPFVFAAGAAASAGGAGVCVSPVAEAGAARRLALGAAVLELASTEIMERRLARQGEAYRRGAARRFGWAARGCLAAGVGLLAGAGRRSRAGAVVGGGLVMAGALSTRWSVYKAGFESVRDPAFVVSSQRDRIAAGDDHGARRSRPAEGADASRGTPALATHSTLRRREPALGVDEDPRTERITSSPGAQGDLAP